MLKWILKIVFEIEDFIKFGESSVQWRDPWTQHWSFE